VEAQQTHVAAMRRQIQARQGGGQTRLGWFEESNCNPLSLISALFMDIF
jgi:hypothetical protein